MIGILSKSKFGFGAGSKSLLNKAVTCFAKWAFRAQSNCYFVAKNLFEENGETYIHPSLANAKQSAIDSLCY